MRKVVFLFGMLMAVNVSFGQYVNFDDATIINKKSEAIELEWFKYSKSDSTVYIYGTITDLEPYIIEYNKWAGMDYNVPTNEYVKNNGIYKEYVIIYEDGNIISNLVYIDKKRDYAELSSTIYKYK
jgi:hypothetical protein